MTLEIKINFYIFAIQFMGFKYILAITFERGSEKSRVYSESLGILQQYTNNCRFIPFILYKFMKI